MNEATSRHEISGYDVVVSPYKEGLQAHIDCMGTEYRVRFPAGVGGPLEGRVHCSMAIAEPLVQPKMLEAMEKALQKHKSNRRTSTR